MRPEQLCHSIQNEWQIKAENSLFLMGKDRRNCCIFVPPENVSNQRNRKHPNRGNTTPDREQRPGFCIVMQAGIRTGESFW